MDADQAHIKEDLADAVYIAGVYVFRGFVFGLPVGVFIGWLIWG